ncbi:rab-protein geranylgeranyltransferase [Meredithblackwellia eburnea MCA 4105]
MDRDQPANVELSLLHSRARIRHQHLLNRKQTQWYHGIKRARVPPVPDSAEVARKKQEKEDKKIAEYTGLVEKLYKARTDEDYSPDALELTTQVLSLNSEFQTGWGIRRTILLRGILKDAEPAARQQQLEGDLQLTNIALRQNPKNYSVWEHRKWVLETMPDADWNTEMGMVNLYLKKDARNFHTWGYRRYVVSLMNSLDPNTPRSKPAQVPTPASELAFSKEKISESFSNFSAWHYRSKLLPRFWHDMGWAEGSEERKKSINEEFDLVKQAMWSDPNDQSAWIYHRWLVGQGSIPLLDREIAGIEELLEEEPDSRWCLDSLVHYKALLVKLLGSDESTRERREQLNVESYEMLKKLQEVDPTRKNRYIDLGLHLVPARR